MNTKIASLDVKQEAKRAALLAIAEAHDGRLHSAAIVDAAEDPRSPLHDEFEWDDTEAAAQYRMAQAGALVRRLKLTIVRQDQTTRKLNVTTTREYQSRPSQRTEDGGYESVSDIMRDPIKRAEMIATVVKEMTAYRRRYEELVELSEVWAAIDNARAEFVVEAAPRKKGHKGDEARA